MTLPVVMLFHSHFIGKQINTKSVSPYMVKFEKEVEDGVGWSLITLK